MATTTLDNNIDDHVDIEISDCLNLESPKSFFLFAGAGSGKTGSLVKALSKIVKENQRRFKLNGRKIGVITFTNKASDEIVRRLDFNPLIEVSTIHSFVWNMIGGFNYDIREWLRINVRYEISDLQEQQAKGRSGTKASSDRAKSIETKNNRLASLDDIKQFTYNPNGDNRGRASLNHAEVIKIGADFFTTKPAMQSLLINKYPILLIDESQDTNKNLITALFEIQRLHKANFSLGLLGDTMQRIYADGLAELGQNLPEDWAKPAKQMNHRSRERIVDLINNIRLEVDGQKQLSRTDKTGGIVRLFIIDNNGADKSKCERDVATKMAEITSDELWLETSSAVKTLILEHHMAASRMGFATMFEPLSKLDNLRTGLLDGTLPALRLFSKIVLPLYKALKKGDEFTIADIVRRNSPLLLKERLRKVGEDQTTQLKKVQGAVDELFKIWDDNNEPSFFDVLSSIAQTDLFEVPESLKPMVLRTTEEQIQAEEQIGETEDNNGKLDDVFKAWDTFLLTPFEQIDAYVSYINQEASFDTHQGVKGLEFPRVMVVIDDAGARGFTFSYEKLFGAKDKTTQDFSNEAANKETSTDRTRRLFYVTCSRAEDSLAIVAYSQFPSKVYNYAVSQRWFTAEEIIML